VRRSHSLVALPLRELYSLLPAYLPQVRRNRLPQEHSGFGYPRCLPLRLPFAS
jgi:hypothetical protein